MSEPLDGLSTAVADHYRFDRELGRGGMATVYLALDLKHERRVTIKVLQPELAASLGAERFLREIELTAQVNHPHTHAFHLDRGNLPQARAAYSKLRDLQPSDGEAWLILGWIDFLQGRLAEAVTSWAEARALDPIDGRVPGDMGLVEQLFGDFDRADRWQRLRGQLVPRDALGGFTARDRVRREKLGPPLPFE